MNHQQRVMNNEHLIAQQQRELSDLLEHPGNMPFVEDSEEIPVKATAMGKHPTFAEVAAGMTRRAKAQGFGKVGVKAKG